MMELFERYDTVLFDLDGTLSESGEGILYAVRKIFEETNRELPDEKELAAFIGPPMYDSLIRCGFSHEEAEQGVVIYKKHFVDKGIYMQKVYDGIPQVLVALKNSGRKLAVATSKFEPFSRKIIKMLGLEEYFDFVGGATSGPERRTKAKVIEYTIEFLGAEAERTVLIGDTRFDAKGAKEAGVHFIGCLYGYGTKKEMTDFFPSAPFVSLPHDLIS